jgi:excinuclease ABC subunit A
MNQEPKHISIKGAREHNLKDIDIDIPKKKFVVITGVSGSGKSSLALDTLYAEGQRRYVESLSAYARQFLGQMQKPKFDSIFGLSPAIAIEQKSTSKNPRSTVGTITEIYDYLRVLFARVGTQYCHICGKKVGRGDATSMVDQIMKLPEGTKTILLSPLVENRKGEHKELFEQLRSEGFTRVRVNGIVSELVDIQTLAKNKKHNIEAVVDRLVIKKESVFRRRVTDSVETALKLGNGTIILHILNREDIRLSEKRSCCDFAFSELEPALFSFNSPLGMCRTCNGIGQIISMDEDKLIPDPGLSIEQGAILPWKNYFGENPREEAWGLGQIKALEKQMGLRLNVAWSRLSKKEKNLVLHGSNGKELTMKWQRERGSGSWKFKWEGLLPALMRRYRQTKSEEMKTYYGKFLGSQPCPDCHGQRLKPDVLSVLINKKNIIDVTDFSIKDAVCFLQSIELSENQKLIASELLLEILSRLDFLVNVGLDYLNLNRAGPTLSGGEAQRIRLASQIGSDLSGVMYILDEPSIGLHQRDNKKLIQTFHKLRDIGNSVIVIEHDRETMEKADWIIDLGPGAGHLGGQVVAEGTPKQVAQVKSSLTGRFLSGKDSIDTPSERRVLTDPKYCIEIKGAKENNLQDVDVQIPLGLLTCVTGVSGAGKSTLINQILLPALNRKLHNSTHSVGSHKTISGLKHLDKVISINQQPIGRTPRSNPATYTKVYDLIRDLFALLPESRARGYKKGRFSFNVKGGRCENCQGDGFIKVEMHFLADVFVPCEVCKGQRFNESTLELQFRTHSIADILALSVAEAKELFINQPKIVRILDTLLDVGLGYIKLGQPATTLSGGEAQRIKLARELAKRETGRTLYVLDEPTTGLHFDDIKKLLRVLHRLVDAGNTVVVIEHNLDVIKVADWIIDMGPDGGDGGGLVIATGTPEDVSEVKKSYTGQFLRLII